MRILKRESLTFNTIRYFFIYQNKLSHDEADVGLPTEMADLGEIRGGDAPPPPSRLVGLGGGDDEFAMVLFWKALRPRRPL